MRFPTARRPAPRRTPEPTTKEKLGGLAPFALEGIMGMFKNTPELKSREDYLKSTAVDATNPTKLEKAKADAYTLFGEPEEKPGFGLNEIVNILAASQMGRGAKDYGTSFSAIRKAKETSRLTKEGQRASFIQKQNTSEKVLHFLNTFQINMEESRRAANSKTILIFLLKKLTENQSLELLKKVYSLSTMRGKY